MAPHQSCSMSRRKPRSTTGCRLQRPFEPPPPDFVRASVSSRSRNPSEMHLTQLDSLIGELVLKDRFSLAHSLLLGPRQVALDAQQGEVHHEIAQRQPGLRCRSSKPAVLALQVHFEALSRALTSSGIQNRRLSPGIIEERPLRKAPNSQTRAFASSPSSELSRTG